MGRGARAGDGAARDAPASGTPASGLSIADEADQSRDRSTPVEIVGHALQMAEELRSPPASREERGYGHGWALAGVQMGVTRNHRACAAAARPGPRRASAGEGGARHSRGGDNACTRSGRAGVSNRG